MVPKVWPDWHSIGYDGPRILRHTWYPKALTWKALGDLTFDLPTAAPSTGLISVNLPSPAIPAGNVTSPSTNPTTESWDKGKGKAIFPDPEPEAEGSKKRKSPLISGLSSQPLKSAMKSHKCQRSAHLVKSKPIVESEDDEDSVVQRSSFPGSPQLLQGCQICLAPPEPQQKNPLALPGHPAVMEPSQSTPEPPVQATPVMPVVDILIPGPKIKCTPANMGSPPPCICAPSTTQKTRLMTPSGAPSKTPSKAPPASQTPGPSTAPPASQSKARTRSQSRGLAGTSCGTAVTTPQTQTHGCSKTITAIKPPAPAPAPAPLPSSRSAVPAAAPGLAVPAAALGSCGRAGCKIDTLQCLHEGLRHEIIDRHPSFPLPDTPANATSLLLDQSGPRTMSPPESALPPLIDLSMETLAPTTATPTFPDTSAIEGLLDIVDPGNPSNLVPEYDSSNNMDVEMEVKVDESSEEIDMAT
ncbi:hypothetical protein BDR03DRAFT_1018716 [Suillus americanus]|nr:hypothetical protein BDR03DRAFT_1018716 [Suillus americanus]